MAIRVPAVITVRARSAEPLEPDASRMGEVVTVETRQRDPVLIPKIRCRTSENQAEGLSLEQAKVVVAGGRGLGGSEGFSDLTKLAETLGGAVGASRVACDLGWCPRSWQIGLTGKTVTPNLYIAIGISGASHHMAGCGNSGAILAINNDPEAAIFKDARFGVIGDYKEIVPAMIKQLADLKA
jgi:electron transfer flavoprotein alpha subunit